ncbi:MAG TPA: hypothetical protein VG204_12020 [Terriglobia bacterium]|nr:hypothetical protein [Terriglobia bacterium]
MEPAERSFWEWAQTRSGQVILFWGTLELILESLDVLSKWDLLLSVRGSLTPGLEFLADPRTALLLVALAFVLLWEGNRPKEQARSILDQPDQPKRKGNSSVVEATAIPFFLAFVCAISFTALEWNSPRREQLAQRSLRPLSRDFSANVERKLDVAARESQSTVAAASPKQKPAGPASAEAASTGHSTPLVTPHSLELDTDEAANADVASAGDLVSPPTLNRLVPGMIYAYNGERKVYDSGQTTSETDTPERKDFDQIRQAHRDKNWPQLASLSEASIQQTPDWLTPYLFAGEAYANLGQIDRAIDRLEYVRKKGAGIPDDRFAVEQASKLRESIRIQYGR